MTSEKHNINIRKLKADDKDELRFILNDYIKHILDLEEEKGTGEIASLEDALTGIFSSTSTCSVLVAENASNSVVGFIAYHDGYWVENASKVIYVSAISISPLYRHKGAGYALMTKLRKITADLGANYIVFTVHNNNYNAIKFYEKLGAEPYTIEQMMVLDV